MKYTKEQRRDIYLKAAEVLFNKEKHMMTTSLRESSKLSIKYSILSRFHEFEKILDTENVASRMDLYDNDEGPIFILLFCAEMCK